MELRNITKLVQEEAFCGRILYIDDMTLQRWKEWRFFLEEYGHVCRGVPPLQRTLFCVCLMGEVADDPPGEDICVAVQRYENYASHIDTLIYTMFLLEQHRLSALEKRLAVSIIASLAMWDSLLAERLAGESLNRILEPIPVLRDFAQERNWPALAEANEASLWSCGIKNQFDGMPRIHSAALARSGNLRDVEQRIWSAEVGVLFPYIEERRQQFIDGLRTILRVPFVKKTGEVVSDLRDLEIGHIEMQLKSMRVALGPDMMREIECLRLIRNHLSHFQLVPLDVIKSGGFIS
jgi:hypothetical protein